MREVYLSNVSDSVFANPVPLEAVVVLMRAENVTAHGCFTKDLLGLVVPI